MSMPYKIGNLGDLVKHTWLIETIDYLQNHEAHPPFRYADTFCGFKVYDIETVYADRLKTKLSESKLYMIQQPFLEKHTYMGSVTIAQTLMNQNDNIDIFDTDPVALESFSDDTVHVLDLKSGYDILESAIPYDIIFLDPYVDFWDTTRVTVRKIAAKIQQSTILIFIPYKKRARMETLLDFIDSSGTPFIHGAVYNRINDLDSTYKYGMILFPAHSLPDKNFAELSQRLMNETEKINAIINIKM